MKILFVMVKEENIDPLNIELLSALAKREGHETFLSILEQRDLEKDLRRIAPDIVAYSAKTGESNIFFNVNRWVKGEHGGRITTIMGGPHPTFHYHRMQLYGEKLEPSGPSLRGDTLSVEDTMLDIIAVGEADEAWPQLLRALSRGDSPDVIPNMITRNNRPVDGPVPILLRNSFLDDLPFLDRGLVYAKTQLKYFGLRTFIATRGCPYPCTYCFNAKFNDLYHKKGETIQRYSVDRMLEELEQLVRQYPTQFIKFYDDNFAYRVDDWLLEFAEKYPKRIGLPFHCLMRADLVRKDPNLLLQLKKAGLHSITMSIEAGNSFVRKHILKRGMEDSDIQFAFDLCRHQNVRTFSNNILAIPAPVIPDPASTGFEGNVEKLLLHLRNYFKINTAGLEARLALAQNGNARERSSLVRELAQLGLRQNPVEYDIETVEINLRARVTSAEFVELAPYPGTPLTQYTVDIGAFDGNFDQLHQTFQSLSPFTCFTHQQKVEQLNLAMLAVPLMLFPSCRQWVYHRLLRRSWTKAYFLIYFLVRAYLLGTRIYPMHYSWRQLAHKVFTSFGRELHKHFQREHPLVPAQKAGAPEILGGSWKP